MMPHHPATWRCRSTFCVVPSPAPPSSSSSNAQQHAQATDDVKLCYLRRKSKVAEMLCAGGVLVVCQHSGVATVFSDDDQRQRLGYLNSKPDEVIRSLFYNREADAVVTVSVFRDDGFRSLRCRSTPCENIRNGDMSGTTIFASEALHWPGFIEFDEWNSKVLTYSATTLRYTVWDLKTYERLYELGESLSGSSSTAAPVATVTEVKASPGLLLVMEDDTASLSSARATPPPPPPKHPSGPTTTTLRLLDIETGEELKRMGFPSVFRDAAHAPHNNAHDNDTTTEGANTPPPAIDFTEQFGNSIFIKCGARMRVIDVLANEHGERACIARDLPLPAGPAGSHVVFLHQAKTFLTFAQNDGLVTMHNAQGEPQCVFQARYAVHRNNVVVNRAQTMLVGFERDAPFLVFSEVATGRVIARVGLAPSAYTQATCLCFDEAEQCVLLGTRNGLVHVIW